MSHLPWVTQRTVCAGDDKRRRSAWRVVCAEKASTVSQQRLNRRGLGIWEAVSLHKFVLRKVNTPAVDIPVGARGPAAYLCRGLLWAP